jgi:hypothetical protein
MSTLLFDLTLRHNAWSIFRHTKKLLSIQALLAQACIPSYLGGWDQKDQGSRPAQAYSLQDPHLQNNQSKMDWSHKQKSFLTYKGPKSTPSGPGTKLIQRKQPHTQSLPHCSKFDNETSKVCFSESSPLISTIHYAKRNLLQFDFLLTIVQTIPFPTNLEKEPTDILSAFKSRNIETSS